MHTKLASLSFSLSMSMASAGLAAQAPSFQTFGSPCAWQPPPLSAVTLPRIGQVFQLQTRVYGVTGGYEGSLQTAIFMGSSRTSWRGLPLPWSQGTLWTQLGVGSCGDLSIAADEAIVVPRPFSGGPVVVDLPVPNAPALVGLSVFFQAADYRINTRGVYSFTLGDAAEAIVGR